MAAHTSILNLENPMDKRSLTDYSSWGHKRGGHNCVTNTFTPLKRDGRKAPEGGMCIYTYS